MIEHVWRRCCQAVDAAKVIIATDDERIEAVARGFGARVEMTSSDCLTGTDRVAEVADRYPADWYINVQGDEPFIDPTALTAIMAAAERVDDRVSAVNAMSEITDESEFRSPTVPKVVTDSLNQLLYVSRAEIPTTKNLTFERAFRQIGVYAFRKSALRLYGVTASKSYLEALEDIEILRLLEGNSVIKMITIRTSGPAIDTPEHLELARQRIRSWEGGT